MKISAKHYTKLESAIHATLEKYPTVRTDYAAAGHSAMRLNWDLLHASQIDGKNGTAWCCDNLYSYLNDSHISTALARIVGNDGKNGNGKR